jgi:hypothetical protein
MAHRHCNKLNRFTPFWPEGEIEKLRGTHRIRSDTSNSCIDDMQLVSSAYYPGCFRKIHSYCVESFVSSFYSTVTRPPLLPSTLFPTHYSLSMSLNVADKLLSATADGQVRSDRLGTSERGT